MPHAVLAAGITGGAGLFGNWLSSRRSGAEKQYTAAQTESAQEQSKLARLMGSFATKQYNASEPAYNRALSYYDSLLFGDRAKMGQALAPEQREISDAYRGAELSLERSGVRGGTRDQAMADIGRDRAGRVADVAISGRPRAAASLAQLAGSGLDRAGAFASGAGYGHYGAGSMYSNLLGSEQSRRAANQDRNFKMGMSLAKLFLPYFLKGGGAGAGSSGGSGANLFENWGSWDNG